MTVTKAYDELRERGLITSHHGKGFYVASTDTRSAMHVFILMDAIVEIFKDYLQDSIDKVVTGELERFDEEVLPVNFTWNYIEKNHEKNWYEYR